MTDDNHRSVNQATAPFEAIIDAAEFGCSAIWWVGLVLAAFGIGAGIWALVK